MQLMGICQFKIIITSFIFCLFFISRGFSQTTKVVYELDTNFNEKQLTDEYIGDFLKNIQEAAHNVEFQLIYNDTIGNYSLIEKNVADENYATAVDLSGGIGKGYYHKNNYYKFTGNSFVYKQNEFLVQSKIESNWTITRDTLNVNGYKCYKAFVIVEVKHNEQIIKHEKIAWFCPEITANFGPNGSGGLPGLIMFFEESGMVYKMKSIKFNDTTKIEIPVLKNIIQEEEYIKKIEEKAKNGFRD